MVMIFMRVTIDSVNEANILQTYYWSLASRIIPHYPHAMSKTCAQVFIFILWLGVCS